MTDKVGTHAGQARKRPKTLLILTSIYGLLYLWFVVVSFLPAPEGNWISTTIPFDPFDMEQIWVKLLFLLFLIGYFGVWMNEGFGGAVFLIWWVAMWCVDILVFAPIKPADAGSGIAMGFPLFVLGILFVLHWRKGRSVKATPPTL